MCGQSFETQRAMSSVWRRTASSHGMTLRRVAVALALIPTVACGADSEPAGEVSRSASPSTSEFVHGCVPVGDGAPIELSGSDGNPVRGVIFGEGGQGIVLTNEFGGNLCDWLDYAHGLAEDGYQVAVWNFGEHVGVDNRLAALGSVVAELRRRGAQAVVLAGGSYGACLSIIATVHVTPPVAGAVSLSCGTWYDRPRKDMLGPAARATAPLLLISGENDRLAPPDALRQLHDAAASGDKTMLVVPGTAAHGVDLVTDPTVAPTVTTAIEDFVDRVS
jgi:hypothetical protein